MSQNNNGKKQREDRRFVGKVKQENGQYGVFQKVLIDNPYPTKKDANNVDVPDPYHQGMLLWCDAKTGKKYLVKQLQVKGVGQGAAANGFVSSLCIDLDDTYNVQCLD